MSLDVKITKRFDGFTLRTEFTAGNTTAAILGASGCGKSMTLRCIAGIVKPDSGRIVLDGQVLFDSEQHIDLPPQQLGAGLLFQNYALFPNMTVEQNILCGLKAEKNRAARQARCAAARERRETASPFSSCVVPWTTKQVGRPTRVSTAISLTVSPGAVSRHSSNGIYAWCPHSSKRRRRLVSKARAVLCSTSPAAMQ